MLKDGALCVLNGRPQHVTAVQAADSLCLPIVSRKITLGAHKFERMAYGIGVSKRAHLARRRARAQVITQLCAGENRSELLGQVASVKADKAFRRTHFLHDAIKRLEFIDNV